MSTIGARRGAVAISWLLVAVTTSGGCGAAGLPPTELPTLAATPAAAVSRLPSMSPVAPASMASSSPSPTAVESATDQPTIDQPSPSAALEPGDPNPTLTPGATNPGVTQANIASTICVSGFTANIRPPVSYTDALKRQQIAQYGYTDTTASAYEEDHLISLEIGGNPRDPHNLWPEPYQVTLADGTNVGARTKDRFEDWLHREVCAAALSLADAQREIAGDWVGAWLAAGKP